jgi:hypothetical protein
MDQGLLHCVAVMDRDTTTLQTKVSKANEALHKAWILELQLSMEVRNIEKRLVQQKTKTTSWY